VQNARQVSESGDAREYSLKREFVLFNAIYLPNERSVRRADIIL
jgi:hypothetical protein